MTVNETKQRIEAELKAVADSFGEASSLVKYSVEIEENHIEGAPVDVTYVFGSLSIGPSGAEDDDRLYLPLDAELDDDDNVDEAKFEENLATFKEKAAEIRDRILASDNYDLEAEAIINDFDREMDEKYRAELERINRIAKRNLTIAAIMAGIASVLAIAILVITSLD